MFLVKMINFTLNYFKMMHFMNYKNAKISKKKNDVSEGIDINKTIASKECELCHYWFFKDNGFKFEEHVCNKCHNLLAMAYSIKK